jgi:hypothetical protein
MKTIGRIILAGLVVSVGACNNETLTPSAGFSGTETRDPARILLEPGRSLASLAEADP